ncbi:23S rRNA (adenine2503-C2)-methyltransferase [Dendrobium catenatum]|uniref:23S rRNA (Adenine2503-C2)-methyltransferase n=1 Tax=Dendrobium catenatum TaxID=906689 RepID=A0A2I0W083_9ASPA|nr:23S rRNA (adenine2503-C2)-methyltransferase [Dendrobium catenatum]
MAIPRCSSSLSSMSFFCWHPRLSSPRQTFTSDCRRLISASAISSESGSLTSSRTMLKDMSLGELEVFGLNLHLLYKFVIAFQLISRLHKIEMKWVQSNGFRPAQALMLWKCLYGNSCWAQCPDELTGLSLQILFTLDDGLVIETVVIPCSRGRTTVCVSSQVGCAMNCQFCYTGRMGLRRHLRTAEIVEQAIFARRLFSTKFGSITNVVFMGMGEPLHNIDNVIKAAAIMVDEQGLHFSPRKGMGEPLHNIDNVIKAAAIMVDEQGLHFSPRKVTVSTSGLVPQLKRFLKESNCALAVSLNATTDEVRNWIMPINRKYNLSLLLETLREGIRFKHKYKVLFEYVMLEGVNDSIEDARRLIELVRDIPCKINLISFNPHRGSMFKPTREEEMIEFRNVLAEAGCVVFLRLSRGDDQMAACGQLGEPGEVQPPLLRVPLRFQTAL